MRAKNYTLTQATVAGTAPANVWNYCLTGVCNYTFANGTSGTFVSPYAGTHTASICQMGYSAAVDSNEYVEPAYITGTGLGTAGERMSAPLTRLLFGTLGSESWYVWLAVCLCEHLPI